MKTVSNRGLRKAVIDHRLEAERVSKAQLEAFRALHAAQQDLTKRVTRLEIWQRAGVWARVWWVLTGRVDGA